MMVCLTTATPESLLLELRPVVLQVKLKSLRIFVEPQCGHFSGSFSPSAMTTSNVSPLHFPLHSKSNIGMFPSFRLFFKTNDSHISAFNMFITSFFCSVMREKKFLIMSRAKRTDFKFFLSGTTFA